MKHQSIKQVAGVVGALLGLAFIANFTVEGWQWGVFDFIFMGALLFATGMALEYVAAKVQGSISRIFAFAFVLFVFLAIWTQLAVGAVSQLLAWIFR